MPPRMANSPVSRTVEVRWKPFASSHAASSVVLTTLPGAAENVSPATRRRSGTRCRMALTVVVRMRGLSEPERDRASRASTVIRRAEMAEFGDTRS